VTDGEYGMCTRADMMAALYEPDDGTPAYGEIWGVGADSFVLRRGLSGWFVIGGSDEGESLVAVLPGESGKTTGGGGGGPSACCCDAFNCLIGNGRDITSTCGICDCSPDPWVMELPSISCGGSVGGSRALKFSSDDSTVDEECVWKTGTISSQGRDFYWNMSV